METITIDSDVSQNASNSFDTNMSNRTETSGGIPNGIPASIGGSSGRISTNFTSVPLNYLPNPTKNINCILVGELVEAARCIVRNSATFVKCSETSGEKWEIKIPSGTSVITVHLKNRDETIIHEIQERSANERNVNTNNEAQPEEDISDETSSEILSNSSDVKLKKLKVSEGSRVPEFPLKECFVKLDRLKIDSLRNESFIHSGGNSSLDSPLITTIKQEVDDTEVMDVHCSGSPKIVGISGSVSEHDDSCAGEISHSTTKQPMQVIIKKEIDTENSSCDGQMEIHSIASQKAENIERKACSTCGFFAKSAVEQSLHSCSNKSVDDIIPVGGNFNHPPRPIHCCIKCQRYSENGGLCSRCKTEKCSIRTPVAYENINSPGEMFEESKKSIHTVGVIHDAKEKPFMPFHVQQHVSPFTTGSSMKDDPIRDNVSSLNGMEENKMTSQPIADTEYMNNFQGKIGAAFSLSQEYSNISAVRSWNNATSTAGGPNYTEPNKVASYTPFMATESKQRLRYEESAVIPKSLPEMTSCGIVSSGFQSINQEQSGKGPVHHQFESHVTPTINPVPVLASYHSESKSNLPSSCALSEHHFDIDVKPFVCDICKQAFVRQDLLKEHQKIHMQGKIYSCNQMMQPSHSSMDDV